MYDIKYRIKYNKYKYSNDDCRDVGHSYDPGAIIAKVLLYACAVTFNITNGYISCGNRTTLAL